MASSILYQNEDATITIIDIPHSIELAQGPPLSSSKRLLSTAPLKEPFPSTEPKSQKARDRHGNLSLNDLLLSRHLQFALDEVKTEWKGELCLPRVVSSEAVELDANGKKRKRKVNELESVEDAGNMALEERNSCGEMVRLMKDSRGKYFYQNSSNELLSLQDSNGQRRALPSNSTLLCGDIAATRDILISLAPTFDLIIMDPPWPNRSARRKKSYGISSGNTEIQELLSSIPIEGTLAEGGTVAIWITNKEAFRDLLLQPGGLFDEWGVTLVEEWIWLKTTVTGEPICLLDSMWRKPYEILLIGKRGLQQSMEVKKKVLIAVPDLHSRKPNLKELFDQFLGKKDYEALEVFARSMTAGWWSWGNEVLKFQIDEQWVKA